MAFTGSRYVIQQQRFKKTGEYRYSAIPLPADHTRARKSTNTRTTLTREARHEREHTSRHTGGSWTEPWTNTLRYRLCYAHPRCTACRKPHYAYRLRHITPTYLHTQWPFIIPFSRMQNPPPPEASAASREDIVKEFNRFSSDGMQQQHSSIFVVVG